MIAMSLTYPLINIGTRMQVQSSKSKESYKSVSDAVKKIFVEDGILGFYRFVACFKMTRRFSLVLEA